MQALLLALLLLAAQPALAAVPPPMQARKLKVQRVSRRTLKATPARIDRAAQRAGKTDLSLYENLRKTDEIMSAMLARMHAVDTRRLPKATTDRLEELLNIYAALARRTGMMLEDARTGRLQAHDYEAITRIYRDGNAASEEFWKLAGKAPGT